jgi:6,7-dimethyl-8-ribityllumazine synthase
VTTSKATRLPDRAIEEVAAAVGASRVGDHDGRGLRIGIVGARFNGGITHRLLGGCLGGLRDCDVDPTDITVAWAPGAFELPLVAQALATGGTVDALICLGAVIRGDTGHYEFVAGQCAAGIQQVQLSTGVPVVFGVLTTDTVAQAVERSEPDDSNKGREAALTAVEAARLIAAVARPRP